MKNKLTILAFFVLFFLKIAISQQSIRSNNFGKSFIVNLSGTYIFENTDIYSEFHEVTISSQMSVSVTQSLYGGIQTFSIFTEETYLPSDYYTIIGGFIQYDFLPLLYKKGLWDNTKGRFYGETSFNYGNYCTCGLRNPYKKEGLKYIGLGGGVDYPIFNSKFNVNFSFISHVIVNRIERKYKYNIYKIGVSYFFGRGINN